MTEKMKDVVLESAAEILDKRKKINKSWVTDDILGLCDTMREKKTSWVALQYSNMNTKGIILDLMDNVISLLIRWLSNGISRTAFDTMRK